MVIIAYKWGGISFDDKALFKTLILPSDGDDVTPITFHDNGNNYQVPGGKVFIVGRAMWTMDTDATQYGRVGEADGVDGVITKEVINLSAPSIARRWQFEDVIGIYVATKYVTAETSLSTVELLKGATLYGVEIDA